MGAGFKHIVVSALLGISLVSCSMIVFPKAVGSKSDFRALTGLQTDFYRNSVIPVGLDSEKIVLNIKQHGGVCGKYPQDSGPNAGKISCFYAMCFAKDNAIDSPKFYIWNIDPALKTVIVNTNFDEKYAPIRCDKRGLRAAQESMATADGRELI